MLILALDTAGRSAGLALAGDDGVLAELSLGPGPSHSRRLLPCVEFLLAQTERRRDELTGLAVNLGPGYFTGLRIGLATAQGLALGLGLPVAGVSSLRLLALGAACQPGQLWAVADARRGLVYAAAFQAAADGSLTRQEEDLAISPARLAPLLSPPALLVGDGARLHQDALLAPGLSLAPPLTDTCRPGLLALEGARRLAAGQGVDPADLRPRYCRPSDAEVRFGLPLDEYRLVE
ncbi:MAG: tRNA (adenosine(37)-N6)-threonylcarbamoyltransferase complex dimerization subunit type 1 TsaB [Deltaproteobacteria bacterium]|nr:tRNA (adenosine(37)-N6)-threonylcarbamoyltransferase complex dimerization subunit type 1 TsaB [Deltaproteobacteria bacterium]